MTKLQNLLREAVKPVLLIDPKPYRKIIKKLKMAAAVVQDQVPDIPVRLALVNYTWNVRALSHYGPVDMIIMKVPSTGYPIIINYKSVSNEVELDSELISIFRSYIFQMKIQNLLKIC